VTNTLVDEKKLITLTPGLSVTWGWWRGCWVVTIWNNQPFTNEDPTPALWQKLYNVEIIATCCFQFW